MSSPMKPGVVGSIASRWRELHGARSWAGLLDPLDADLRAFLIAYGELASASYDGFNNEERSPHRGACVYSRAGVLAGSTVSHPEYYNVTKFPFQKKKKRHQVPLCDLRPSGGPSAGAAGVQLAGFRSRGDGRGSGGPGETRHRRRVARHRAGIGDGQRWRRLAGVRLAGAGSLRSHQRGRDGAPWLSVRLHVQRQRLHVLEEVWRLMEVHKDEVTSITVTGHSLGASLAVLNTVDMVANSVNVPLDSSTQPPCPVTAILFASPQAGNNKFKSAFASFDDLHALHVKNAPDIIPTLPGPLLGYVDVATATVPIDTNRSPYLYPNNRDAYHNLECYLHGVAGDHGDGMDFKLVVDRDVALVNKKVNVLKDEYPVPANWFVAMNKWMVKGADGHWKLDDFKEV